MRKIIAMSLAIFAGQVFRAAGGDMWSHMLTSGTPIGNYFVGDPVGSGESAWYVQFELGWVSWNQSDAGIGPDTSDDGDWTWVSAGWYQDGGGNNKRVQGNIGAFHFSSPGNWYINGRVKEDSWDPWHYANDVNWDHSGTFNPAYYFSVSALNNPSGPSATAISPTQIDLSWSADPQGHWVMVVRNTTGSFTAPTQGHFYNVGDTVGGDQVVYKGGALSYSDTGVTGGKTYYYRIYSENWSYFSVGGVTANATTPRPTDSTWDGGGSDDNFKTEANWNNDVYPDQGTSTKLTFAGSTRLSPNNNWAAGSVFNEIFFASGASSFTVGGNAFTIRSQIVNNDDSLQTINNNLTFHSQEVALNAASGALTIGGTVNNAGYRVASSGANTLTLNGVVSGTGDLVMFGSGTLVLNAANTFNPSGSAAYLVNGTTRVNNNSALGVGTVEIGETWGGNPSTLQIGSGGVNVGNNLYVRSGSSGTMTIGNSSSGAATFSGSVTLAHDLTLANNSGGTLTLSGAMSFDNGQRLLTLDSGHTALISGAIGSDGGNGLVKRGDGVLQLGGANTFHGLYIDRGTVELTGGSLASGYWVDIGTIYGDTAFAAKLKVSANSYPLDCNLYVKTGSGLRTLETANSSGTLSFSGTVGLDKDLAVVVANGSATVDAELAGVVSGAGGISKSGDGVLLLSAANSYSGDTAIQAGTLRLSANDRLSDNSLVNVSSGATFDMNGAYDRVKGLIGAGSVALGSGTGDRLRVGGDNADRTFSGVISGGGNAIKEGAGAWTLSGANTYTGDTVIEGGVLRLGQNDRLSDDTLVNISAGATFDINNYYDKVKGVIGAGNVTLGSGTGDRLRVGGDNADRTFSGVISGGGNVIKEGTGVWTLSGANTYTGDTKIEGGTVRVTANDRLADGTLVNVGSGGALDMNDYYDRIKGLMGEGSVTLGAGTGDRLRVGGDNASRTFLGVISGGGNVIKEGTGNWTLSGVNTLTGAIRAEAGSLTVTGSANSAPVSVAAGAFLYGTGSVGTLTVTGQVSAGSASNTVGQLAANTLNLEKNGAMQVEITDMTGTAGTSWDLVVVGGGSGVCNINAIDGNDFVIAVRGNPANFNNTQGFTNVIVDAGSAPGFAANKFTVNTAEFTPSLGAGEFSVANIGGDLALVFTPPPAPDAPVATAATSIDHMSFVANWNSSVGATSYRLDVAYDSGFTSLLAGYNNLTVAGTSQSVTVPAVGQYYYRVRAVNDVGTSGNSGTITVGTKQAQGRNKSGGSPYSDPATVYVGDTATFGVDTWATVNGNYGKGRVVVDTDSNIGVGGLYGAWQGSYDNVEYTEVASPTFTSAGVWYWGIQMDYGSPYGTNFWMVRNTASWSDLYYSGTNANLSITVTAIGNPTGVSAAPNGGDPEHAIDLAWSKWNGRNVMIVRSTDNSFGTPTPGQAYSVNDPIAGDVIVYNGSGASFTDTGLSSSSTYYYRFYSVNNNYYSSGADADATTDGSCAGGVPPVIASLPNQSVSRPGTMSFTVLANDPGCTAPTLTVAGLPTGASFNTSQSGTNRLGTFSWTPTAGQVGTHLIRFIATDSDPLTSDKIIRLYVAAVGEPTNSAGVPDSQTNWAVAVTNVIFGSGGNVTVVWDSVSGILYDVYRSDNSFGSGMTWTKIVNRQEASGTQAEAQVASGGTQRFFQVVASGEGPTSNGVWGVIKPTVPTGFSMLSAPVITDGRFDGKVGAALAASLTANSDEIYLLNNGNWVTLHVDGSGVWRDGGNSPYTTPLAPGQGMYVKRNSLTSAQPSFAGPVGNRGARSSTIIEGWNIIGFSEGKVLPVSAMFESGKRLSGSPPVGSYEEEEADLIMFQNANNSWRRLIRMPDNTWFDLSTGHSTTLEVKPGQAYYYYRQPGAGSVEFSF